MRNIGSGQITITDLTDGDLKVELMSSLPMIQRYNTTTGADPDWSTTNLVLTPSVTFNNGEVALSNEKLTFTYMKRVGTNTIADINGTNEIYNPLTKTLTVKANNLLNADNKTITYICVVTYTVNNRTFSDRALLTFSVAQDGQKGDKGDSGVAAYNIILSNENHTFAGSTTAALTGTTSTTVVGYRGSSTLPLKVKTVNGRTANTSEISTGIAGLNFYVSSIDFANSIEITFKASTKLTQTSGTLQIEIEMDGKTFEKTFSYTISLKGANGASAKLVTISPSAQIFKASEGATGGYTPNYIYLYPNFQETTYKRWSYSTDGITWITVSSGTKGLSIGNYNNISHSLRILNISSLFTSTVTSVSFKCESTDDLYDVVTIAQLTDASEVMIGARNYVVNSDFSYDFNNWTRIYNTYISIVTEENSNKKWVLFDNSSNKTSSPYIYQTRNYIFNTSPNKIIVSFDAQNLLESTTSAEIKIRLGAKRSGSTIGGLQNSTITIDNNKKRYNTTFNITEENIDGFIVYIEPVNNSTFGAKMQITNIQLEIANTPSAWQQAPEDVTNLITTVSEEWNSELTQTKTEISAVVTKTNTITVALSDSSGNLINVNEFKTQTEASIRNLGTQIDLAVTTEDLKSGKKNGTQMTINSELVRVGWNGVSQYWSFVGSGDDRGLNLYYGGTRKIFNFNDNYLTFYDGSENNYLKARFDRTNWIFYKGNSTSASQYKIASIGSNYFRIYNGAQTPTEIANFTNNGIQLNDTNGSKRVVINSSYINMYGSTTTYPSLQISNSSMTLKNAFNGYTLTTFNSDGATFYRDNERIGKVGINSFSGFSNSKGLVFDLDYKDQLYMSFAAKTSSSSQYITKLTWANFDVFNNGDTGRWTFDAGVRFREDIQVSGDFNVWNGNSININRNIQMNNGTIYNTGLNGDITIYNGSTFNIYRDIDLHKYNIYNQSDGRLKKNIKPNKENALEMFEKMRVRSFNWCEDNKYTKAGFIAQELNKINKEFVKEEEQFLPTKETIKIYSINQLKMIPYLVKAIQELYFILKNNNLNIDINELIIKQSLENIDKYETISLLNSEKIGEVLQERLEEENFK